MKPTAILRINLEEPLFSSEYSVELLEQIYRVYRERVQPEGKCWLFMNEVQADQHQQVYCHLKRQHEEVYYYSDGGETDFVVKEGMKITRRIQVWYADASETTIPDRELACFRKPLEGHDGAETILVTNDYEDVIDTGAARVRCVPVIMFFLSL